MEDFSRLFDSKFKDPHRPLGNTLAGLIDHAVRLRAGLPTEGLVVPELLAACLETEALAKRVQLVQQQLGLSLGTQKQAGTQTGTALDTALERIRKNEGTLKGDALIENAEERQRLYALLYPTGDLGYYTKASLDNDMADRLGEYLTRTEAEKDHLGEPFVKRVQDDLGPFRKTRETQVGTFKATDDLRTDRHDLVDEINEQCDYNYHLLSAHFRKSLNRAANYWKASFYLRAAPRAAPGSVLNLAIQAHQHRQVFDLAAFPQLTQVLLTLRDGGPVQVARVAKTTAPLPAATLPLALGTPLQVLLAEVPGTGPHLVVYNDTGRVVHLDGQLS